MTDVIKKNGVRTEADDLRVGSDFYDALEEKVAELISDASDRAEANGRKTLKPRDV